MEKQVRMQATLGKNSIASIRAPALGLEATSIGASEPLHSCKETRTSKLGWLGHPPLTAKKVCIQKIDSIFLSRTES